VEAGAGQFRIGELARRAGVAPELLRAWERRYGLLEPARTQGGFRLYSAEDERRVAAMVANLARGYSAAEAAQLTLAAGPESEAPAEAPVSDLGPDADELRAALDDFDDGRANRALDRLLAAFSLDTVLTVVLGYLRGLGDRWERGEASIAQEHFASNVLRGRLLGLARGWGQGTGPRALLACAPGEQHDLPLLVFGLALRTRGFRVTFLGPDTPVATLADAVDVLSPALVVVSVTAESGLGPEVTRALRPLGRRTRLALAGRGVDETLARASGAELLGDDPVAEAERLAAGPAPAVA